MYYMLNLVNLIFFQTASLNQTNLDNPSGLKGKRLLAEKSVRMTIWQKNLPTSHSINLMA